MTIQVKIEQTAKEYKEYKNLYDEKVKDIDSINKSIAEKSLNTENKEDLYNYIFDTLGSIELIKIDMNQMKVKLYHYLKLAEDLVEIPKEIKDLVEDYKPQYVYTTKGDIANKELYEQNRKNFIEYNIEFNKLSNTPTY